MKPVYWKNHAFFQKGLLPCFFCGKLLTKEKATVDHYVPRAAGGRESPINYKIACVRCNRKKADTVPADAHELQWAGGGPREESET
jgi:5-methylcytosine-specific restriction endonuclease McrA